MDVFGSEVHKAVVSYRCMYPAITANKKTITANKKKNIRSGFYKKI